MKASQNQNMYKKLVFTHKNPTKGAKLLCKYFRALLTPDIPKEIDECNPNFKDSLKIADFHMISHFIQVSDNKISIGVRPNGPTYHFSIVEKDLILKILELIYINRNHL